MIPSTTVRVTAHTAGHVDEAILRRTEENVAGGESVPRREQGSPQAWLEVG